MKLYTVYTVKGDDSWEYLRTLDKKEAIDFARNEKSKHDRTSRVKDDGYYTELRMNIIPDGVNYKEFDNTESDDYNEEVTNDFYFGYDLIYFDFDERLKEYREKNNLTVPQLAKYLNVPQRTLENWLSGKTLPNDLTASAVVWKLK